VDEHGLVVVDAEQGTFFVPIAFVKRLCSFVPDTDFAVFATDIELGKCLGGKQKK
jgi:hypothetical protein